MYWDIISFSLLTPSHYIALVFAYRNPCTTPRKPVRIMDIELVVPRWLRHQPSRISEYPMRCVLRQFWTDVDVQMEMRDCMNMHTRRETFFSQISNPFHTWLNDCTATDNFLPSDRKRGACAFLCESSAYSSLDQTKNRRRIHLFFIF
jgi:hypothetical protein